MSDYLKKREREKKLEKIRGKANGKRSASGDRYRRRLSAEEAEELQEWLGWGVEVLNDKQDTRREEGHEEYAEQAEAEAARLAELERKIWGGGYTYRRRATPYQIDLAPRDARALAGALRSAVEYESAGDDSARDDWAAKDSRLGVAYLAAFGGAIEREGYLP